MNFLSVKSWAQEEPSHTNEGTVLVSVVYSGTMLMDGSREESVSVRARSHDGGHLLLDGVHRASIEAQALDMLNEGCTRDDTWEWIVSQVCRTLNRGLYIECEDGGETEEDLAW